MDDSIGEPEAEVAPPEQSLESASPASEEQENQLSPRVNPVRVDALRRLRRLEGRQATVGTQLDEMRALLAILFEMLPE